MRNVSKSTNGRVADTACFAERTGSESSTTWFIYPDPEQRPCDAERALARLRVLGIHIRPQVDGTLRVVGEVSDEQRAWLSRHAAALASAMGQTANGASESADAFDGHPGGGNGGV